MKDFMSHENVAEPPSLSDNGLLRSGDKSDIVTKCLKIPSVTIPEKHDATVAIYDMPAVLHFLNPTRAIDFVDYSSVHVNPYLSKSCPRSTTRLDTVYDRKPVGYPGYIKSQAHIRRGKSQHVVRTEIGDGRAPIPRGNNWQSFFKDKDNCQELYDFTSERAIESPDLAHLLVVSDKGE